MRKSRYIFIVQCSIYVIEQICISAYLKNLCSFFFSYDDSPVLLAADYAINSNFFFFFSPTVFIFVVFRERETRSYEKERRKVGEGGAPALLGSANCHVHFARHLYLSPERIKHALVNTALASREHDFD